MANGKITNKRNSESAYIILLAIGVLLVIAFYALGTHPNTHEFVKKSQVADVLEEKMSMYPSPKEEALTEPLTLPAESVTEVEQKPQASITPDVTAKSNELIVWERLIAEGFSREQAAGVMGNLQQEHNFKTDDVPGGLGIAQWMGNRRANLIARGNHTDLNVQLTFMMKELRGTEHRAMRMLQAATTVEAATIAFQNGYERCGNCKQQQRINYANAWYRRF